MRSWQLYGIAALLWAAIFLPGLGDPELKGEEGRRILPAREMLRTGEWVVPFSEGKPYSRKPPMINWAIAASFRLTGVENEWSARLPSVLAVLAGSLVLLWAGRPLAGDSGSLVAAISFLACVAQVDKGRLAEIEALYVALTAVALALWLRLWQREASPWLTYTIPWLFLGLAMLTKGPLHLLFFYGILTAILRDAGRQREWFRLPHLAGIMLMTAVFLPWAVLNARRVAELEPGAARAQAVWLQQLTERLDPSAIQWGDYVLVPFQGVLNFAPWCLFLLLFWRRITPWSQAEPGRRGSIMRGLKWGMLVTFLAVSLIPEARPRFTMPLFGAAAILCGWIVSRAWETHRTAMAKWWGNGNRVLAAVAGLAALLLPLVLGAGFAGRAAGVCVVAALWLIHRKPFGSPHRLAAATASVFAAVIIVIAFDTRQLQAARENVRPLGAAITAALPADATLAVFKPGPQPLLFYVDRHYIIADRPGQIPPDSRYLLLRPEHRARALDRRAATGQAEPMLLLEIEARDGKRYQLLQL